MFVVPPRESPLSPMGGGARGVSTLMNISLLAGLPLSALAFVLRANPSERRRRRSPRHLDTSLRSLLKSQRPAGPLLSAVRSAEEAVF